MGKEKRDKSPRRKEKKHRSKSEKKELEKKKERHSKKVKKEAKHEKVKREDSKKKSVENGKNDKKKASSHSAEQAKVAPPAPKKTPVPSGEGPWFVVRSLRNDRVITRPSAAEKGKIAFHGISCDLISLGFNYLPEKVESEIFQLVLKGDASKTPVKMCDLSQIKLRAEADWEFEEEVEEEQEESEPTYADQDEVSDSDSDFVPDDDSPEAFAETLANSIATIHHEGWTFRIECHRFPVHEGEVDEKEYERLAAYGHQKTHFIIHSIEIDLDYKPQELEV